LNHRQTRQALDYPSHHAKTVVAFITLNHRFQPDIIKRYQLRIKTLEKASGPEDLYPIHSLHYEKLKGDKEGLESIRVNDQYRIEFKIENVVSEMVITICNIMELSNHYK